MAYESWLLSDLALFPGISLTCETHQEEVREAREYFKKTGNVDGALQRFPRYLTAERALVSASWILQTLNIIKFYLSFLMFHLIPFEC